MELPIYYVVAELLSGPIAALANVAQIIAVYECDFAESRQVYQEKVAPLFNGTGRRIITYMFVREPNNPFKDRVSTDVSRET